ncbi:uncharacterized protein HKW66_Vig0102320 [Vigna angularis]|uniref:Uncharacterized protein n=1 Tax=Phaseolus angularis TaxID=3914 RepID=A0A8T0KJQ8_PHAAN|nr:uncharacterized protein HKW66_Vig0102320 [Vigna angularis]
MILWVIEHSATDRLEASESTWLGRKHVVVTYHLFLCLSPVKTALQNHKFTTEQNLAAVYANILQ